VSESADVDVVGDAAVDVNCDVGVGAGDESTGHVAVAVHDNDNDNVEVQVEEPSRRFEAERGARGFAGHLLGRVLGGRAQGPVAGSGGMSAGPWRAMGAAASLLLGGPALAAARAPSASAHAAPARIAAAEAASAPEPPLLPEVAAAPDAPDPAPSPAPSEEKSPAPGASDSRAAVEIEEDLRSRVVTAAAKREQTVPNAPGVVEVITAEEIARAGYRSVGEALKPLAGVVVYDDYVHSNVGVRGIFGGERAGSRIVKVFVDGQPVAYRPSSVNFLGPEMLPIELVERIEIIRGPGSVLYGANAFLGGINVVTKSAEAFIPSEAFEAAEGVGLVVRGGAGTGQASAQVSGAAPPSAPGLGAFGSFAAAAQTSGLEVVGGATRQRDDRSGLALPDSSPRFKATDSSYRQDPYSRGDVAQPTSAYARAGYSSPSIGRLRVFGVYQRLDCQGEFQDRNTLSHDNTVAVTNAVLRADLERRLGRAVVLRIFGAFSAGQPSDHYSVKGTEAGTGLRLDEGYRAVDTGLEIQAAAGRWLQLLAGADFTWDEEKRPVALKVDLADSVNARSGTALVVAGEPGKIPFRNAGIYGLLTLTPFSELEGSGLRDLGITAGARYEANSVYGSTVNWRGGLVLPLGEQWYVKALGGSSFKGPSAEELYGVALPLLDGDLAGNPNLRPQTALTLEGVLGFQPSRYFSASAVAYYSDVRDQIRYEFAVGNTGPKVPQNMTRQQTGGVEVQVRVAKPVERWTLGGFANATLLNTTVERPVGQSTAVAAVRPDLYPPFTANLGIDARYRPSLLGLYIEGRLLGPRPSSRDNEHVNRLQMQSYDLPTAFTLDAALSTDPIALGSAVRLRAQIRVANLLNAQYALPGFYGFDIPGRPRTFSGQLEVAF
jgi:outer membrane receptor for ferrienterochelin and colicins